MSVNELVYVVCQLSRSGFPSERIFRVATVEGKEYIGSAPLKYCRTSKGEPLSSEKPGEGKREEGQVAARIIRINSGGSLWLSFPDGNIAQVSEGTVIESSIGGSPNVPIKS
jgi:hypothetical protein